MLQWIVDLRRSDADQYGPWRKSRNPKAYTFTLYVYIYIYIHTPFSVDLTDYILCVVHYSLYVDFVQYTSQILRSASIAY